MPPLQPFTGSSGDRAGFLLGAGNLAFVRRDEIESLYAAGVDVVVGVIAAQAERIAGAGGRDRGVEAVDRPQLEQQQLGAVARLATGARAAVWEEAVVWEEAGWAARS